MQAYRSLPFWSVWSIWSIWSVWSVWSISSVLLVWCGGILLDLRLFWQFYLLENRFFQTSHRLHNSDPGQHRGGSGPLHRKTLQ